MNNSPVRRPRPKLDLVRPVVSDTVLAAKIGSRGGVLVALIGAGALVVTHDGPTPPRPATCPAVLARVLAQVDQRPNVARVLLARRDANGSYTIVTGEEARRCPYVVTAAEQEVRDALSRRAASP